MNEIWALGSELDGSGDEMDDDEDSEEPFDPKYIEIPQGTLALFNFSSHFHFVNCVIDL
jgi:hypothetical protein